MRAKKPEQASDMASESHWSEANQRRSQDRRRLERQSMQNWYLLATICALSTIGLLAAVMPAQQTTLSEFWPATNTDVTLLVGLGGSILLFVLYLTVQQRRITNMRLQVQALQNVAGEREKQYAIRLHALLNVTRMMGAISEPVKLFQGITGTCLEIFDCQQASLMIVSEDGQRLEMKAAAGHRDVAAVREVTQPIGRGIAGYVAKTREPLLLGPEVDPDDYPGLEVPQRDLNAAMVTPIIVRDELVGVLNISSRSRGTVYTEEDLQALELFAINAGNCIHQAERTEWMRQTIQQYRDKETVPEDSHRI